MITNEREKLSISSAAYNIDKHCDCHFIFFHAMKHLNYTEKPLNISSYLHLKQLIN